MILLLQVYVVLYICFDEKLYLLYCVQVWIFFNREKKLVMLGVFDYNIYIDIKFGKVGFVNIVWLLI